jgi:F0F1-type ATP synthase membrane subunit c/vacuolar-type H+-ATPase subunit K
MDAFNFKGLAILLAGLSVGLIGLIMTGAAFFPEVAEQYKRQFTTVIVGVILVSVASAIVGALGG